MAVDVGLSDEALAVRGADAKQLLDNPLLQDAFKAVKEEIVQRMLAVDPEKVHAHTRLIDSLKLVAMVEAKIKAHIQTGEMAKWNLEKLRVQREVKVPGFRAFRY